MLFLVKSLEQQLQVLLNGVHILPSQKGFYVVRYDVAFSLNVNMFEGCFSPHAHFVNDFLSYQLDWNLDLYESSDEPADTFACFWLKVGSAVTFLAIESASVSDQFFVLFLARAERLADLLEAPTSVWILVYLTEDDEWLVLGYGHLQVIF